ncbi:uncharacterized protein M421DRAFT_89560 [Didymella exigua CBS 183.55]|uniref:Uncharacterized protein n=1 Tax=Didymella exigua CBS 183.55 TaxID=1150837 RepID=A0A6A5RXC1_9PLEO|nr:uncharacterized protein M421DRAFT_89560 [Didymella exigua CBS 183.55]KAF1932223.1 hypothetical protein M421DRAFT_89560 [Didymella exigua CBS 183.55]
MAVAGASRDASCSCSQQSVDRLLAWSSRFGLAPKRVLPSSHKSADRLADDLPDATSPCFCNVGSTCDLTGYVQKVSAASAALCSGSPSSLPTGPVEHVRSVLNNAFANATVSVGEKGDGVYAWSSVFSLVFLLVVLLGLLAPLFQYWLEKDTTPEEDARDVQINALQTRLRKYTKKAESWEEETARLNAEIDHLHASISNLSASFNRLSKHNTAIEACNQDLEAENEDVWHRNQAIEHENVNWRATWTALRTDKDALRAQLTTLQDVHTQLITHNMELQGTLEYVQHVSTATARRTILADSALGNAESRIALLEDQLEDEIAGHAALRVQTATHDDAIARLEKTAAAQALTLAHRDDQISALRAQVSHLEGARLRHARAVEELVISHLGGDNADLLASMDDIASNRDDRGWDFEGDEAFNAVALSDQDPDIDILCDSDVEILSRVTAAWVTE